MLDPSSQMARAQLQRHISNSSSVLRRRASRVTKPASTGSSPQPFQRRRATTQTIPRYRTSLYQQCLDVTPEATEGGPQQLVPRAAMARPVSWHPSTLVHSQQRPQSSYEVPYQPSYPTYTTYNINGIPTPMTQAEFSMGTAPLTYFNVDNVSGLYQQSRDYEIHGAEAVRESYFDDSYPQYISPTQQPSEGHPIFSPVPYPASAWTGTASTFSSQTAPPTPDVIPFKEPPQQLQNQDTQQISLRKEASKELIGMGLYDGPDRNSWSLESMLEGPTNLFAPGRPDSMGKGLKLEETWEPPEEEDETDSEEQEEEDGEGEAQEEQDAEGYDEMFKLAEGALGLEHTSQNNQQRPPNVPNPSFLLQSSQPYADAFGTRNLWQGQIADYCVG